MDDKGNVFDVSTTLMEIEDLPESEADSRSESRPAPQFEGEPEYFGGETATRQPDIRRRALAALGLVGGMVALIALLSAAAGLGDDHSAPEPQGAARPGHSLGFEPSTSQRTSSSPRARQMARRSRAKARARAQAGIRARAHARARRERAKRRRAKARARARARKARDSAPSQAAAPATAPEPTYYPEPETSYVPAETAPPSPAPTTPSSSPSGGGDRSEFGIEP